MKKSLLSSVSFVVTITVFLFGPSTANTRGKLRRRLPPYEYGTVLMEQFTEKKGMEPVVFRHWSHRVRYTCRLCHIDIGFSMERGQTIVQESDNRNGLYCGVCHNGKEAFSVKDKKKLQEMPFSVSDWIGPTGQETFLRGYKGLATRTLWKWGGLD